MVYTGKPSRACGTCKKRRIKCDEGRPKCGQCIKSKRDCTGYKSETELMFRDETKSVVKKAVRTKHGGSKSPSPDHDFSSLPLAGDYSTRPTSDGNAVGPYIDDIALSLLGAEPDHSLLVQEIAKWRQTQRLRSPITVPLQEAANAYFFNHFVAPKMDHAFKQFRLLYEMYGRSGPDDAVTATTDAIAMLSLSQKPGNEDLRSKAAGSYGKAVRRVSEAVADPQQVRLNSTLLCVLMLGFAETLDISTAAHQGYRPRFSTEHQEKGIVELHHAWGAHAAGAELLVKLRSFEELTASADTLLLASWAGVQVVIKNMITCDPIADIEELWVPLQKFKHTRVEHHQPHLDLMGIAFRIPHLRRRGVDIVREAMRPGLQGELIDLLSDARAIDQELSAWSYVARGRSVMSPAGYHLSPGSGTPEEERVWPGVVYNYKDMLSMNAWNMYRVVRIVVQMLIFNLLERLINPDVLQDHPDFLACRKLLQTLADEVCGSVPYGMGYVHSIPLSPAPIATDRTGMLITPDLMPQHVHDLEEADKESAASSSRGGEQHATGQPRSHSTDEYGPAIGAWYCLWPLYNAKAIPVVPPEQKRWITSRLKLIAKVFGIQQANMYARHVPTYYVPGEQRRFLPQDFAPPPWEPLQ